MRKLTEDRIPILLKLRQDGLTYKEIAKQFGISQSRVQSLHQAWLNRLEDIRKDSLYELSTRTRNAILSVRGERPSLENIRQWIISKDLHFDGFHVFLRGEWLSNMGRKSFLELCQHLGLEECASDQKTPSVPPKTTSDIAIKRAIAVLMKAGYKPPTK